LGVGQWVVGGAGSYRYAGTYIVSFGRQTKSGTEIGDGSEGDANSALEKTGSLGVDLKKIRRKKIPMFHYYFILGLTEDNRKSMRIFFKRFLAFLFSLDIL